MRGEHATEGLTVAQRLGSSPHARGTRRVHGQQGRIRGIIPACAGNTTGRRRTTRPSGDHPRMRGEHHIPVARSGGHAGSSPHARGTQVFRRLVPKALRIIPACAGNTQYRRERRRPKRDHPRMRGEHEPKAPIIDRKPGSSPHARGTHRHAPSPRRSTGIIPACAGNTCVRSREMFTPWDHPRMRGEH